MGALVGLDLHGVEHLARIEAVRVDRFADQPRARRGGRCEGLASVPAGRRAEAEAEHEGGGEAHRGEPGPGMGLRHPANVEPGGDGLFGDGGVEGADRLVLPPPGGDGGGILGVPRQVVFDARAPGFVELAVGIGHQLGLGNGSVVGSHLTVLRRGFGFSVMSRRAERARAMRDISVPLGMPRTFAASA